MIIIIVVVTFYARKKLRIVKHSAELSQRLLEERTEELQELERAFEVKWEELQVRHYTYNSRSHFQLVKRIDLESPGATGEVWRAVFNDTMVDDSTAHPTYCQGCR